MMRWNDGLEGAALRIASTNASPLRIVAGPGTGKTFSLMRRVARLLQGGATPQRIFVSTFTRTAARDLEESLRQLGVEGATAVRAGTIHSFCFSVLAREEVLLATGRTPRPLLAAEERFLLEDLKGAPFGNLRDCRKLLQAFNAAWARLQTEEPGWPADAVDREFGAALESWLRFHKGMLIGEIVPVTLGFLRDNPATSVLSAFDHVIVDEYQDLNRSEQILLDVLAASGRFTLVGDEDQSIYSFKHAHPEGITQFKDAHPGTHDESLEECRRCPQSVVIMANALVQYNQYRQPRVLQLRSENPIGEVHVVQWTSVEEEAAGIAGFIRARIAGHMVSAGKVLVLAPRRQFGYAIRDAMNEKGTPAHSFFQEEALDGDPKKMNESQAQQAVTLLNLLADPDDRVALRCWCGFGSPSLRSSAWKRLRRHCEQTGQGPREALEQMVLKELTLPNCRELVSRFELLQQKLSQLTTLSGNDLIDNLFPADQQWAHSLRGAAETLDESDIDALKLREGVRTAISQPELPVDVDYVRVMSLHKSKGLTADLVVVAGCIEGLIPTTDDQLSLDEQAARLEEQRRLFYVAVTRTRQTLVLSSVTQLPRNLAYKMGAQVGPGFTPSARTVTTRFLSQLGPTRPRAVSGQVFLRSQGL
ncbi:MAG: ATP-dependent helicase UvrD/PcrA [Acidobacteriota bacterium]|jgi:superfamily I DNA/RNA helicase|nr:ATP-dependent helicase UvrD/PcrA [Acidobacteriota bacterium]